MEKALKRSPSSQSFVPPQFYQKDLGHQLTASANLISKQFNTFEDLKLKTIISLFTFGRYVNSSLGINRYALVYEPTWASLRPGVISAFVIGCFIFLIIFVNKGQLERAISAA